MDLVIDSNIIISAIISRGITRALLFSNKISLFAPELLLEEFERHKQEILQKSKLSESDLELALSILSSKISFVPFEEFKQFLPKARETCPDPKDTEFFAVALSKKISLWSNDKAFKKQTAIEVLNTGELAKKIR